jgi:hypothetical protein
MDPGSALRLSGTTTVDWVNGVSTHSQYRHEFRLVALVAIAAAAVRFSTPSFE